MSNQFYDYLAKKLVLFFKNNSFEQGERFLINLDNKEKVNHLVCALKKYETSSFEYTHDEKYDSFKTFCIDFKDNSIVIVGDDVESGFLVTLRNVISDIDDENDENRKKWENKILLIVTDSVKDSIVEGSTDLREKGFPLNMDFLSSNLYGEINQSELNDYVKDILYVYLDNLKENTFYETNIWDLKEVLSVLNKGKINYHDYKGLNLFYDSGLESLPDSKTRKKRILGNYNLFSEILNIVNFKDFNKEIERKFDENGIDEITARDNWFESNYNILYSSLENKKREHSKLNYYGISSNLAYWDCSDLKNSNERNIIIFNNKNLKNINIMAEFDRDLDREYLNKSSRDATVSNNTLKFKIRASSYQPIFKRYIYHHEHIKKNKYIFNICVLNISEEVIHSIKDKYKIKSNKEFILLNNDENFFKFGEGDSSEIIVNDGFGEYDVSENNSIVIDVKESLLNAESGEIDFNIIYNDLKIPFKIDDSAKGNILINPLTIWNKKRILKESFLKDENTLKHGKYTYNLSPKFKFYLDLEEQMISENILCGVFEDNGLKKVDVNLPEGLRKIYNKIFHYFSVKKTTPTLAFIDEALTKLYDELLDEFINEIDSISSSGFLAFSNQKDLLKLGVIKCDDLIMYSSLSPLNIAYQLEINKQCGDKELNKEILDSLIPNNLLPYIVDNNDKLFSPIVQKNAYEWIIYKDYSKVSIGTTDLYLSRLVKDKLNDFINNFSYLFDSKYVAPIKINIVNINHDKQIVKGIFKFIESYLPNNIPIPVEIHIYNNGETYFDDLFECSDETELDNRCDIKLKSNDIDSMDILRTVQENIKYYCHDGDDFDFHYAHISFYKPSSNLDSYSAPMDEMETGLSLNGIISALTSNNLNQNQDNNKNYRTGFGIKNANLNSKLVILSKYMNELACNSRKEGKEPYSKNQAIVTMPDKDKDKILKDLFEKSNWVTFIDPNFGLDYFANNGVFIIHYSDQYTSSSKYDTITVTKKHNQYIHVIDEYLKANVEKYKPNNKRDSEIDKKLVDVIKIFNSINGEWLLKIGSGSNSEKDKVSMVSAIKYALAIFNHDDIIWIPISMAEVLRVSGNLGLKETDGLFSIKNLRNKTKVGKYSDDLLLIGLNLINLEIYLYPIEVKIGINPSVSNAKKQVIGTYNSLMEFLPKDELDSFDSKFYRNFFIQLFLSNCQKFIDNNIWSQKDINRVNNFKKELLNDEYVLSWKLESLIGIGAFICFKDGETGISAHLDENILIINFPEGDGYSGVISDIDEIINLIKAGKTNIPKKYLIYDMDLDMIVEDSSVEDSSVDVVNKKDSNINKSNSKSILKFDKNGKFIGF